MDRENASKPTPLVSTRFRDGWTDVLTVEFVACTGLLVVRDHDFPEQDMVRSSFLIEQ